MVSKWSWRWQTAGNADRVEVVIAVADVTAIRADPVAAVTSARNTDILRLPVRTVVTVVAGVVDITGRCHTYIHTRMLFATTELLMCVLIG